MGTIFRHAFIVVVIFSGSAGSALAQVITPQVRTERLRVLERELQQRDAEIRILETDPVARDARLTGLRAEQERLVAAVAAEKAGTGGAGSLFLTQAGFEGGTAGPQVSIDAAHLFFRDGATRMFVRSTLPTNVEASDEPADSLDDRIRLALSDPYGGLFYLAVGQMIRLPKATGPASPDEGVFLDLRGGAKFVRLPGKSSGGAHASTAFAVLSAGIRVRQSLWTGDSQQAGMLEVSALLVANRGIDRAVSPLTDEGGELDGWPSSFNIAIGLRLADGIGLTLRGAPWTNTPLSKNFTIGIALLK